VSACTWGGGAYIQGVCVYVWGVGVGGLGRGDSACKKWHRCTHKRPTHVHIEFLFLVSLFESDTWGPLSIALSSAKAETGSSPKWCDLA